MAKITLSIEAEEAKMLHKMLYYIGEDEVYPNHEYNLVAMNAADRIMKAFLQLEKEEFKKIFNKDQITKPKGT